MASNDPKTLLDLFDIMITLNKNHKYRNISVKPPIKPYSSMIIANIKSEEDWGKKFFWTLLPGPNPVIPPVAIAILAFSIW